FVDTGQHWDEQMAGAFFAELGLPRPDHSLGIGGGTAAEQTAGMLRGLEPILSTTQADAVLVYGDTNSTLAGALVRAQLHAAAGGADIALEPGRYMFATVHRAENRTPDALRAWAGLLTTIARPERPVVLALHPGTRAALAREAVRLPPDVCVVEPLGYRTSL